MATHDISCVPGACVCFGSLDFIVMTEGGLAQAPAAVQPLHSAILDTIDEALAEVQLHAPEIHAFGSGQPLDFNYGRLER